MQVIVCRGTGGARRRRRAVNLSLSRNDYAAQKLLDVNILQMGEVFVEKIRFADKGVSVMKQTVVGLVVFLLPVTFSNVLASDEAHHIKDAADCQEIIEHYCAAVNSEKDVEMCLVAWYQEHHLKHDADAAALTCRCWSFCAA